MGIVYSENSKYVQEMQKWETPKRLGGMAPDGFEEFPKMLYIARANEQGHFLCGDPVGEQSFDLNSVARAQAFTKSCQTVVYSLDEQRNYESRGWRSSPKDAIDYQLKQQDALSTAAAEEQYRLTRMTEPARREFDDADRAVSEHLATLPAPKKRGRKPKIAAPVPA